MRELRFHVEGAAPLAHAAAPTVALSLRVTQPAGALPVEALLLRCQVRIHPLERRYSADEQARLRELFGDPGAWNRTAASLMWTQLAVSVPGFTTATTVELALPCGYDFGVAAYKYAYGLDSGELPLTLLFSGTVFREDDSGDLRALPIPWSCETAYALPITVLRATLDEHYPDRALLPLRREVFDRLYRYRLDNGLSDWEQALERLLHDKAPRGTP